MMLEEDWIDVGGRVERLIRQASHVRFKCNFTCYRLRCAAQCSFLLRLKVHIRLDIRECLGSRCTAESVASWQ